MGKFTQKEETQVWKPTKEEALTFAANIAKLKKRVVNGRMQYPFELYLEQEGVISFNKFGQIQVISPVEYNKYVEINEMRKWMEERDLERLFAAYPEEKEPYEQKRRETIQQISEILKSTRV